MRKGFYLSVTAETLTAPYSLANVFVREENYYLAEHTHPFYHVNFVTEGQAVIQVGEEVYTVTAPGYMIIPPTTPHAISSVGGYSQVGMNVEADGSEKTTHLAAFCEGRVKVGGAARICPSFDRFFTLLSGGDAPLVRWRIGVEYDTLLLALLEAEAPASAFAERLSRLAMERDVAKMGLSELCEALHFSKTHLERLFKKEMGESAMAYLARLRTARAAALLLDSDLPLSAIAEECGFFDASHFGKCFKRATGVSPGEYRRRNR